MSKLLLQITTGILALIPIVTGVITMLGVNDRRAPTSASSFSSFWVRRYLSTGSTV